MLWRLWALLSGLPVGVLVALSAIDDPSAVQLCVAALAGGGTLALLVTLLARRGHDEMDRGRHLGSASGVAWVALPAAWAVAFGWSPGAWLWPTLVVAVLAIALLRGSSALGPAGGALRWLLTAAAALLLGAAGVLAVAAASAVLGAPKLEPTARFSAALHAIDATVVTRPLPKCRTEPRAITVVQERGANPALTPDGAQLWFDAPVATDAGRRQIHRLDRASGAVACWTCGLPGNNVRPSIASTGASLVYETDRHASWRHPDDTELYLTGIARRTEAPEAGRRLSFSPGPDSHPVFGPGPRLVTWSRRDRGRYEVASASIRAGHGGLLLGRPAAVATGGAEWIAPVAWAPDARSLLIAHGNPFAALRGELLDPSRPGATPLPGTIGIAGSFSADGGFLGFATTRSRHWAGVLPAWLGFALAPLAQRAGLGEVLRDGTAVYVGPSASLAEVREVALPDAVRAWGAPAGLALEPDGYGLVLGQRRPSQQGVRERLVEIRLDCVAEAAPPAQQTAGAP